MRCNSLTKIVLPDAVKEIGGGAFRDCENLAEVTLPQNIKMGNAVFENTPYSRKKGCYIATCIYDSYDCPQVWTLRRYRDEILSQTWFGRMFICTYYATSPPLVKWFGQTKSFHRFWRRLWDKKVYSLKNKGLQDAPYEDKEWICLYDVS